MAFTLTSDQWTAISQILDAQIRDQQVLLDRLLRARHPQKYKMYIDTAEARMAELKDLRDALPAA